MIPIPNHILKDIHHLEDIYTILRQNNITFSKTEAMKIVGSRSLLEKLVATKKIRMIQQTNAQFGRWDCNAEDVMRYANFKARNN